MPTNNKIFHIIAKHLRSNVFYLSLAVTIVTIIIGVGLAYENQKVVIPNPAPRAHYLLEATNKLSFLSNWDGPIYLNIAKNGYERSTTNFFPLYPGLIHLVHYAIPSYLISGLIVSWLALVGAIYFYLKIFKRLYHLTDNLEALRGVLLFILYPTGVFLLASYPSSLFALLALGSIYFGLNKRWLVAALFCLALGATHLTGLFVVGLLVLLMIEARQPLLKIVGCAVTAVLGLAAYMIYLKIKFHDGLAFIGAQKSHNWLNLNPAHILSTLGARNGLFALLLVITVIYWWRKRLVFALYSLVFLSILLIGAKNLGGLGRYTLMAFPSQIMLFEVFRRRAISYQIVLVLSAIFWAYFLFQYAGGYTGG